MRRFPSPHFVVILPLLTLLTLLTLGQSCAVGPEFQEIKGTPEAIFLTILHSNDLRGQSLKNSDGEGGLAAQATLIRTIRNEVQESGGHVLLLSGGNVNSEEDDKTQSSKEFIEKSRLDFRIMYALGYDAMVVGNLDFRLPLRTLKQQEEMARFPFLSANVFYSDDKKMVFKPYILKNYRGIDIAILGLTTMDALKEADSDRSGEIGFSSPLHMASQFLPFLKKRASAVIALSHLGYFANEQHGDHYPGDVTLAKAAEGIDVIVGGHTGTALESPVKVGQTLIVQAGQKGEYLGRLDLKIRRKGPEPRVEVIQYTLIPINKKLSSPDPSNTVTLIEEDEEILRELTADLPTTPPSQSKQ